MTDIRIAPESPEADALKDALAQAAITGKEVVITVTPERHEAVFEPGDRVEVQFDSGWGTAEVTGFYVDTYDQTPRVKIKYGPGGKHSTTLPAYSVKTRNFKVTPAVLTVGLADRVGA